MVACGVVGCVDAFAAFGCGAMSKLNQEFDEDELLGELEITEAGADAGDDPEASKKKTGKLKFKRYQPQLRQQIY